MGAIDGLSIMEGHKPEKAAAMNRKYQSCVNKGQILAAKMISFHIKLEILLARCLRGAMSILIPARRKMP
jgi:hypothetical protein